MYTPVTHGDIQSHNIKQVDCVLNNIIRIGSKIRNFCKIIHVKQRKSYLYRSKAHIVKNSSVNDLMVVIKDSQGNCRTFDNSSFENLINLKPLFDNVKSITRFSTKL